MRRELTVLMLLTAMCLLSAPYASRLRATPASGFVGTTIAVGRFGEINAFNSIIPPDFWKNRHHADLWLSLQKTKGKSDVYVQSNVWHTHPGHSLIIVTAGEVTAYDGDDPKCKPTVYTVGMGLVDPGGDHIHNLRNEGAVEARTIAVQLIPADATRRIDAAD